MEAGISTIQIDSMLCFLGYVEKVGLGFQKIPKKEMIYPFNSKEFREAWEQWKLYKLEEKKFVYGNTSEQVALKRLFNLAKGNEGLAIASIQYSISNKWNGIYIDKNYEQHSKEQSSSTPTLRSVTSTILNGNQRTG